MSVKRFHVISWFINNNKYQNIVEIGVAEGHNGRKIIEFCPNIKYTGVDPYFDYDDYKNDGNSIRNKIEWNKKESYEKLFEKHDNATHLEMTSIDASKRFKDDSVDVCFIDGNHRYKYVLQDIKAWWPKIKSGGMLMGHDYGHPRFQVAKAVHDFFDPLGYKVKTHPNRVWSVTKVNPMPWVIFFYWGDQYSTKAKQLSNQLSKHEIFHNCETPDLTEWIKKKPHSDLSDRYWICRFIPTYIKMALLASKHDILYVHSDTELLKPFNNSYFKPQFGICIEHQRHLDESRKRKFDCLASPLYFEYRKESLDFLDEWERRCLLKNKKSEHEILKELLNDIDLDEFKVGYVKGVLGSRKREDKPCFLF